MGGGRTLLSMLERKSLLREHSLLGTLFFPCCVSTLVLGKLFSLIEGNMSLRLIVTTLGMHKLA